MNPNSPNGPTIPESTNFNSGFMRILKITEKIESDSFEVFSPNPTFPAVSPTFTTLSNGYLSNLNNPVLDQDGATLSYVQANAPGGNPAGPAFSVQFNDSGSFNGSTALLFNPNGTPTLTADFISDTILTIGSGTVNNLLNPILGQQAATKNYVDNILGSKLINIVGSGINYTASQMINGIISRSGWVGSSADTTDSAASIITYLGPSVQIGSTFNLGIKNINPTLTIPSYNNIINLSPGIGVSFSGPNPIIYPGYQYNCLIHVMSITPPLITIYTISSYITNSPNFSCQIGNNGILAKTVNVSDYLLNNNIQEVISTSNNSIISPFYIKSKVIIRNGMALDVIDSLDEPQVFMGLFPTGSSNTGIKIPDFWYSGGVTFYIINQGTFNVTLDGVIGWTVDPNSNRKIPPGYTGWFMIALDIDFPETIYSARLYTLGIYPST